MVHSIKKRNDFLAFLLSVLVLLSTLLSSVSAAMASEQGVPVSVSLSSSTAIVGESVTVSGTAAPERWISIKIIDAGKNIILFDGVKSSAEGKYIHTFKAPSVLGSLTVVVGYGSNVGSQTLTVKEASSSPAPVIITKGEIVVGTEAGNRNLELTQEAPEAVSISVPQGVQDVTITLRQLLNVSGEESTSAPLPALNIAANTAIGSNPVEVKVAKGTTIKASSTWDGIIHLPTVQANDSVTVTPESNKTAAVSRVIEVGAGNTRLEFSKAVRMLVPGEAGKDTGYVQNGVFTKINTVLTADSQAAGDALPAGGEGKINVGNDLVIWTKHFTQFVTYTQTTVETPTGGGGGSGGGSTPTVTTPTVVEEPKPVSPVFPRDITGHWAEAFIKQVVTSGAMKGYPDQTFKPENSITRAEFATTLVKALKLEKKEGKVFADASNHWAMDSISTASAYGIINGYDGNIFAPDEKITREQMAVMIARAKKMTSAQGGKSFSDKDQISPWAKDAVAWVSENNIMSGYPDNNFQPQAFATRAEVAKIITRM